MPLMISYFAKLTMHPYFSPSVFILRHGRKKQVNFRAPFTTFFSHRPCYDFYIINRKRSI